MSQYLLQALGAVANLPSNTQFTLKQLFSNSTWNNLGNQTIQLGIEFSKIVKNNSNLGIQITSPAPGTQQYIKL